MSQELRSFKGNLFRLIVLFCVISLPLSISIPNATSAADLKLAGNIPLVSLTFDDGDQTIYSNGFTILNTYGIPGTVYMITGSLAPTWNGQLKTLENHGWEVGSHSVNHFRMDELSADDQIRELSQSKATLQAVGVSVNGFAYPYGSGSSHADIQERVAQYYSDARSVTAGYNSSQSLQKYVLFSMAQDINTSLSTMKGWVDQAIATRTWLIICMHTVDNTGNEYSISPETLTSLASYIKSKVDAGTIRVVNVRDGLSLYGGTFPGPVISSLSVAPSTTTASINWTTNTTASTIVDYGLTASYAIHIENTQSVTSHTVNLSGLTACTTYHYRARSRDANNIEGTTLEQTFTTTGCDVTQPVISQIGAAPGDNQAVITWHTDQATSSQVEYGREATYGNTTARDTSLRTSHSVTVTGLAACTTYHYRVRSSNAAMNESISGDNTFKTTGCDVTPPVISQIRAVPGDNQAVITWTTNEDASSRVAYDRELPYDNTTETDTLLRTSHFVTVTGLMACTQYHYRVYSIDAALNEGTSGDNTFKTTGCDVTPPVISKVGAAPGDNQVVITWTTNEGASSRVEYGREATYGSTTETDTSLRTSHSVTVTRLMACTNYHYRIYSIDAALNEGTSGDNTFKTTGCDVTPPVISKVGAVPSTTQIGINWWTEEKASSFVEYGFTSAYGSATQWTDTVLPVYTHSVTLPTTRACTLYHYRIHSKDESQNEGISQDYTVTTPCYKIFLSSIRS